VIKFKDDQDFTTKNYPPLSSSITVNSPIYNNPQPYFDIQTSIVYNNGVSNVPLDGVTFYEDFAPNAPQSIGAFYKGYFVPTQSTENCHLTASVNVIDPPYFRKDTLVNWIAVPQYYSAIRLFRDEIINGYTGTTTVTFPNNTFNIAANNVYAITVAPSGATAESDYRTWFADSVNDQLLQYDIYGNLLTTYQLSAMTTLVNNQTSIVDYRYISTYTNDLTAASPNDIALDGKNNLWVSLFDSGKVIKIDNTTGNVIAVAAPSGTNTFLTSSDYNSESGFAGENLYLPSSINTDINNNLWVAYTHPEYSMLMQYQGENNFTISADILQTHTFPPGFSPEQIQIDRNSNVWVTAINHNSQGIGFSNRNDYLYKFDTNGNLAPGYPLSGFQQIGNLTIDGNQNAWVVQGAETLTRIDGKTSQMSDYVVGLGNNTTEYICSVGGITCDTSNNIWVINNFDKKLYIIDGNTTPSNQISYKYNIDLNYPIPSLPPVSAYSLDPDAADYISRTGITNPVHQTQINSFVVGIKDLGLWEHMVAWPMRQTLNAGSGSTVYSLGGYQTANGTMSGNAGWSPAGITFTTDTDYIDYGTFNVNASAGGFNVHALVSSLGVPVSAGTLDTFNFFRSVGGPGGLIQYHYTNGVGGGATWQQQASYFNGFRVYDNVNRSNDLSKDVAYSWIADYMLSPTLSTNTFQYNGVTTGSTGKQLEGGITVDGNFTMRSYGRGITGSSAQYRSTPNSRISYLLAFEPDINMTSQTMSAVYTLCQNTLNAGEPDAEAYINRAGITDPKAKQQIYQFVAGAKQLGIWQNMVCWPLIDTQNASTGNTVYPLGGLSFNNTVNANSLTGAMINSPQWGSLGVSFSGTHHTPISGNQYILTPNIPTLGTSYTIFSIASTSYSLASQRAGVYRIGGSTNTAEGGASYEYPSFVTNTEIASIGFGGNRFPIIQTHHLNMSGLSGLSATNSGSDYAVVAGMNSTTGGYLTAYNPYAYNQQANSPMVIGKTYSNLGIAADRQYSFTGNIANITLLCNTVPTSALYTSVKTLFESTLGSDLPNFGTGLNPSPDNLLPKFPASSSYTRDTPIIPAAGVYSDGLQEFQAIGDWNGYSWLNKYAAPVSTIRTITGSSNLFNIYPDQGQFNIAKINENWNASGYYDSLRFQETLLDKQVFFDQFLGVILGGLNAQPYELGKTVYEKIANFVDNNSDVDKVNINELLAFCRELSVEFDQYNIIFPPQLRRLVDLLSIKQSKLWGAQNKYGSNFDPRGTQFPNEAYGINLGSIIDPLTGFFYNGVPIVAQEVFSGNYKIVNTNFIDPAYITYNNDQLPTLSGTIPLSSYITDWGWGLVAPNVSGSQISNYYNFYNYNPVYSDAYYDNVIDWTNPYTTLSPTNSSYNTWSQDGGIIQSLLSYELTKGFKLFTSAAHITYNS
jgi:hypothetical protein